MKFTFALPLLFLVFTSCFEDDDDKKPATLQWKKLGLDGKIVNELRLVGNQLFAATNDGLYKKDINGSGEFSLVGFEGKNVYTMGAISDQHILASLFDRANHVDPPALYATHNGGADWHEVENDFGGVDQEGILDLVVHPEDEDILYATGWQVVAKSTDHGTSWTPIWGDWGGFGTGTSIVTLNPHNFTEVWAGGQGGIENGYLLRSQDEENWDEWTDLVDNPTVVKKIAIDPTDAETVYAGYEGALIKSSTSGDSWETLIDSEENRFFFGIGFSDYHPDRVYAAGWLKRYDEPQPLKLFYTDDKGTTWKEESFAEEDFGGVYDMLVTPGEEHDRIFLGLYKGGVYEVVMTK